MEINGFIPLIIRRVGSRRWLAGDQTIVLSVRADPPPENAIGDLHSERPVMRPHSDREEPPDPLEMERRVSLVRLQKLKLLIRERSNRRWQCVIASPEARRGVMNQSFRERPAR